MAQFIVTNTNAPEGNSTFLAGSTTMTIYVTHVTVGFQGAALGANVLMFLGYGPSTALTSYLPFIWLLPSGTTSSFVNYYMGENGVIVPPGNNLIVSNNFAGSFVSLRGYTI
jgi:hypothetical protein